MLFYEPLFVTFFLAFYALYLQARRALSKKLTLLIASLLFYLWGEPVFVLVLLVSTAFDYALSFHLNKPTAERTRRLALAAGIAGNLGILVVYKYGDFLIGNLNLLLSPFGPHKIALLHLALPIGVSFVVFEKITYLVDTWRGTSRPAASFADYCLFVLFFPKLLAGPILKYHEMKEQIASPPAIAWDDVFGGFLRFARGIGRKLLIADPLGAFATQIFAADPATIGPGYAWLGLACFTLQIYFDFAGYSDMAIGLARTLGFRLKENFNSPYVSRSITEFWRRWHISLTTWIRDYLYIPLGGDRRGDARTYVNLDHFLAGLWHGASWNFVLWGRYAACSHPRPAVLRGAGALRQAGHHHATLFIAITGRSSARKIPRRLTSRRCSGDRRTVPEVPPEVPLALVIGTIISLFPATRLYHG